jgi:post-segregation antitoxin (ccd killing protein)
MAIDPLDPILIASYARRYTVEQLDAAITTVSEAIDTGMFQNLSVLGLNVSYSQEEAIQSLVRYEKARDAKLAEEDAATEEVKLDAVKPLGHELRYQRTIE